MNIKEKVIKESELFYRKNVFSGQKGVLTLTNKRLYFTVKKGLISKKEEILYDVPLENVRSADAVKVWALDGLQIRFSKDKVETMTFVSASLGAQTLQTTNPQFIGWAQAINEAREKI